MPALPRPKTLGEVDDAEKQFSAPLFPFFILLYLPPGRPVMRAATDFAAW